MSWGLGMWGLTPWGIGAPAALSMVSALATSTHTVLVELSVEPLALSPIAVGDALNPATWAVSYGGTTLTVLQVTQVSFTQYELRTLEPFAGFQIAHTVSAADLVDTTGALIASPTSATFPGVIAAVQPLTDAGITNFDLANPQSPGFGIPGTIPLTAAGDYQQDSGAAFAEKLIIRAVTTALGGFFHLPNYGFGLGSKQNVTPAKLGRIKADLIRVVENIPVVSAADVQLDFANDTGVLTVTTRAQLRDTGQQVQVVNHVSTRGVQL